MNKILSLLFCFLGLTAFFINARSLKGSGECELVFYGPNPDPVCTTYIDENGKEQQDCQAVGAPPSRTIVDASASTYSQAHENLYEVDFYGTCNCKLVLFTEENHQGEAFTYSFKNSVTGIIFADQVWNKANGSYKINCCF